MKKGYKVHITLILIALLLVFLLFTSCKTKTIYIPLEMIKTEYRDTEIRDSIYLHDSVLIKHKGDTVYFEKYRYLYRDKLVRDSIYKTDSIAVPYPVVEIKEVNSLNCFQSFQVWCGRILLLLSIGYFGFSWLRRFI